MRNHGGVGRGCGVKRGLGVTLGTGIADGVGVGVSVAVGLGVGVGVGVGVEMSCQVSLKYPLLVWRKLNPIRNTLMSGRSTRCKCDRNGAADKNSGCARKVSNLSEFHRA
jgi:hypothetical protein